MTTITTTEFRHAIGKHLQLAENEPVIITRSGKRAVLMVSYDLYVEMYEAWLKVNPEFGDGELLDD